jgi:cellulose synthase/poly-beta-1,6-N-acetylglucosamine synthase-like glycosyltransferase
MILLFLVLMAVGFYPLVGYPIVVWLKARCLPRPVRRAEHFPTVTVLIPAYNEAESIRRTVQNKLDQDYPAERLQIIVVSDCSDDGTDDIVREFASQGVILLRRAERKGKAAGLNEAVRRATGEILVFSDANSVFQRDAITRIVENFADPEVGYVTGSLRLVESGTGQASGGSAYLKYENWVRGLESAAGSIIGVNGGCDAMRRAHYDDVPTDQITDFVLPLRTLSRGLRVIFDPRVRAEERANEEMTAEFRMRVRVALRAMRGLWYMRNVLNPLAAPWVAFCVWSHKVLRYLSFAFLLAGFLLSAALATRIPFLGLAFGAQALFYGVGSLAAFGRLPASVHRLTALPGYFVASNVAFAMAFAKFVRGESLATWRPRSG